MNWQGKMRFAETIAARTRSHKQIILTLAGAAGLLALLQVYFLQELLAEEILFVVGFAALLLIGGSFYLIVTLSERGLELAEARAHIVADRHRHNAIRQ
jgi:uncharacterized membrane protein YciS (DUF1049 family)